LHSESSQKPGAAAQYTIRQFIQLPTLLEKLWDLKPPPHAGMSFLALIGPICSQRTRLWILYIKLFSTATCLFLRRC